MVVTILIKSNTDDGGHSNTNISNSCDTGDKGVTLVIMAAIPAILITNEGEK